MSSGKWRPFCIGLNVYTDIPSWYEDGIPRFISFISRENEILYLEKLI